MSNFDITELLRDGQTDRRTDRLMEKCRKFRYGKADAYVAKSGGQGDVSCKV